ncbi:muscle M-line assembly protein unc-89-like isoform X2 [Saccostrea echinata]|uniref:muscle M-line assembly protein unc-89-like isoform X2 n=1 Tax=Saccostrea echinata TaxID=191078 RepID=UPI002A839659|nr:muscle M-line assembly protein unc-89-like isoform X2 [Saccostrea echinata]
MSVVKAGVLEGSSDSEEEVHVYKLKIHDTDVKDAGEWRVEVADKYGSTSTSCNLAILDDPKPKPSVTYAGKVSKGNNFDDEEVHLYKLRIHDAQATDAGRWRCEVEDKYGSTSSSCNLLLDPYSLPSRPKFVTFLRDQQVEEGFCVKFQCVVTGNPIPRIEWYRDLEPIGKTSFVHTAYRGDGTAYLQLFSPVADRDSGTYRCVARNSEGSSFTEAHLTIRKQITNADLRDQFSISRARTRNEELASFTGHHLSKFEAAERMMLKSDQYTFETSPHLKKSELYHLDPQFKGHRKSHLYNALDIRRQKKYESPGYDENKTDRMNIYNVENDYKPRKRYDDEELKGKSSIYDIENEHKSKTTDLFTTDNKYGAKTDILEEMELQRKLESKKIFDSLTKRTPHDKGIEKSSGFEAFSYKPKSTRSRTKLSDEINPGLSKKAIELTRGRNVGTSADLRRSKSVSLSRDVTSRLVLDDKKGYYTLRPRPKSVAMLHEFSEFESRPKSASVTRDFVSKSGYESDREESFRSSRTRPKSLSFSRDLDTSRRTRSASLARDIGVTSDKKLDEDKVLGKREARARSLSVSRETEELIRSVRESSVGKSEFADIEAYRAELHNKQRTDKTSNPTCKRKQHRKDLKYHTLTRHFADENKPIKEINPGLSLKAREIVNKQGYRYKVDRDLLNVSMSRNKQSSRSTEDTENEEPVTYIKPVKNEPNTDEEEMLSDEAFKRKMYLKNLDQFINRANNSFYDIEDSEVPSWRKERLQDTGFDYTKHRARKNKIELFDFDDIRTSKLPARRQQPKRAQSVGPELETKNKVLNAMYDKERQALLKLGTNWVKDKPLSFIERLKSKSSLEGNSVLLSCFVTGKEPFIVLWYRRGIALSRDEEENFHIRSNGGFLSLEIPVTSTYDTGEYMVEVRNEEGKIKSNCYLQVEPVFDPRVEYKHPEFIEPIHHVSVKLGQAATFSCKVKGTPAPFVRWFKDGIELQQTDRIDIHQGEKGQAFLLIHDAEECDTGLYKCEAQSMAGRCRSTAKLQVLESMADAFDDVSCNIEVERIISRTKNAKGIVNEAPVQKPKAWRAGLVSTESPEQLKEAVTAEKTEAVKETPLKSSEILTVLDETLKAGNVTQSTEMEISLTSPAESLSKSETSELELTIPLSPDQSSPSLTPAKVNVDTSSVPLTVLEIERSPLTDITSDSNKLALVDTLVSKSEQTPSLADADQRIKNDSQQLMAADVEKGKYDKPSHRDSGTIYEVQSDSKDVQIISTDTSLVEVEHRLDSSLPSDCDFETLEQVSGTDAISKASKTRVSKREVGVRSELPLQDGSLKPDVHEEGLVSLNDTLLESFVNVSKPFQGVDRTADVAKQEVSSNMEQVSFAKTTNKNNSNRSTEGSFEVLGVENTEDHVGCDIHTYKGEKQGPAKIICSDVESVSLVETTHLKRFQTSSPISSPVSEPSEEDVKAQMELKCTAEEKLENISVKSDDALIYSSLSPESENFEFLTSEPSSSLDTPTDLSHPQPSDSNSLSPEQRAQKDTSLHIEHSTINIDDQSLCTKVGQENLNARQETELKASARDDSVCSDISSAKEIDDYNVSVPAQRVSSPIEKKVKTSEVEGIEKPGSPSITPSDKKPENEVLKVDAVDGRKAVSEDTLSSEIKETTEKTEKVQSPGDMNVEKVDAEKLPVEEERVNVEKAFGEKEKVPIVVEKSQEEKEVVQEEQKETVTAEASETVTEQVETQEAAPKQEEREPQPPTFVKSLPEKLDLKDGDDLLLQCITDGLPKPEVIWMHENKPIEASENIFIKDSHDVHALEIKKVNHNVNSGVYTAKLVGGSSSAEQEDVVSRCKVFILTTAPMEESTGLVEEDIKERDLLPLVEKQISTEQEELKLQIPPSVDLQEVCEEGQLDANKMHIPMVSPTGVHCHSSPLDKAEKEEELPPSQTSPHFSQALDEELYPLERDENVRIQCVVAGEPCPKIVWFKDGVKLEQSSRVRLEWDPDTRIASVLLKRLHILDTGEYECIVYGENGSYSTKTTLHVKALEMQKVETIDRDDPPESVPPKFFLSLKDKRIFQGKGTTLDCVVKGNPEPEVKWLRHGKEIVSRHGKYTITNLNQQHSLTIEDFKKSDEGCYTVEATSESGCCSSSAYLTMEAVVEEVDSAKLENSAPEFTSKMEGIISPVGGVVTFKCSASGYPVPKFKWQKDMLDLYQSKRITIDNVPGETTLTIHDVNRRDSGMYVCIAKNNLGRSKQTAKLIVSEDCKETRRLSISGEIDRPEEPVVSQSDSTDSVKDTAEMSLEPLAEGREEPSEVKEVIGTEEEVHEAIVKPDDKQAEVEDTSVKEKPTEMEEAVVDVSPAQEKATEKEAVVPEKLVVAEKTEVEEKPAVAEEKTSTQVPEEKMLAAPKTMESAEEVSLTENVAYASEENAAMMKKEEVAVKTDKGKKSEETSTQQNENQAGTVLKAEERVDTAMTESAVSANLEDAKVVEKKEVTDVTETSESKVVQQAVETAKGSETTSKTADDSELDIDHLVQQAETILGESNSTKTENQDLSFEEVLAKSVMEESVAEAASEMEKINKSKKRKLSKSKRRSQSLDSEEASSVKDAAEGAESESKEVEISTKTATETTESAGQKEGTSSQSSAKSKSVSFEEVVEISGSADTVDSGAISMQASTSKVTMSKTKSSRIESHTKSVEGNVEVKSVKEIETSGKEKASESVTASVANESASTTIRETRQLDRLMSMEDVKEILDVDSLKMNETREAIVEQKTASGRTQVLEVSARRVSKQLSLEEQAASTTHQHHLHHPPEIIVPPENQYVSLHSEIELTVKVRAAHGAKISWFHDGQEVAVTGEHYEMTDIEIPDTE